MDTSPLLSQDKTFSRNMVYGAGLATSAATLLGVYLLDASSADVHIMGWYADYVLPVGAILVGLAAGSGYGFWAWLKGVKVTWGMVLAVGLLQVAVYFGARYIEFARMGLEYKDGTPVPFLTYLDLLARSFAWAKEGGSGDALGAWGYLFYSLEMLGFVGGGVAVPLFLRMVPYCEKCQLYMKSRKLGLLPASIPPRKIKKKDAEAQALYQRDYQDAFSKGQQTSLEMQKQAGESLPREFKTALMEFKDSQKALAKLPQRISVELSHCSQCSEGIAKASLLSGQGKQLKTTLLWTNPVKPFFVQEILKS